MFKWILTFLLIMASPMLLENVWAFPEQWESLGAELSLYKIIHDEEAKIVSTSSVSLNNGATQLTMYLQTKKELYRCVELKDFTFTTVKYFCEKLIKPEYEMVYPPSKNTSPKAGTPTPNT